MHGEVIEDYPDRDRALLLGFAPDTGFPVHIVAEYYPGDDVVTVVSDYIPFVAIRVIRGPIKRSDLCGWKSGCGVQKRSFCRRPRRRRGRP